MNDLESKIDFLKKAEGLKDTLRSAHTSKGRVESVAEHTWRLCLMAMVFQEELGDFDFLKLLKMCIVHDLGEVIDGDIPAVLQSATEAKSVKERQDFEMLIENLPDSLKEDFLGLWDDYEYGRTYEAKLAKGLDKLETILQHTQGKNPPSFDYNFNLSYGKQYMDAHPLFGKLRTMLDKMTTERRDK